MDTINLVTEARVFRFNYDLFKTVKVELNFHIIIKTSVSKYPFLNASSTRRSPLRNLVVSLFRAKLIHSKSDI